MDMQSNNVKHKAPDESQPAKEEVVESHDVTLEDGAVQTGEVKKPLKCNICGKRFINILALEGHMKIQVKPEDMYGCHICRQDFKQVIGLTEHVYMHEAEAAEAKAAAETAAKSDAKAEAARLQAKKEAKEAEAVEVAWVKDEAEAAPDEEARLKVGVRDK